MNRFIKRFIPWNYRYRRHVPPHHRRLIAIHRLAKPNWFVGAAEQASVPRDPTLVCEIESVKQRLRDYRNAHAPQQEEQDHSVGLPATTPR